jgi:hypothetical protein
MDRSPPLDKPRQSSSATSLSSFGQDSANHSIPIGRESCGGLVQSIFSSPSRRSTVAGTRSVSRRAAELKMLCKMCCSTFAIPARRHAAQRTSLSPRQSQWPQAGPVPAEGRPAGVSGESLIMPTAALPKTRDSPAKTRIMSRAHGIIREAA